MSPNQTPKEKFLSFAMLLKDHKEMTGSNIFDVSTDYALQEYIQRLHRAVAGDFNSAAVMGIKIQGAQEFLQILMQLSTPPQRPPTVSRSDNLV